MISLVAYNHSLLRMETRIRCFVVWGSLGLCQSQMTAFIQKLTLRLTLKQGSFDFFQYEPLKFFF